MFQRLQATLTPKPEEKYAGTYEGKTKLMTIEEGRELQTLFFANVGNRKIKSVQLLAQSKKSGHDTYIEVESMLNDRFPTDKPIDLYLEVEQGPDVDVEVDVERDPALNPAATKGQILLNVYDTAMVLLKDKATGIARMMAQVDQAVGAPLAAVVPNTAGPVDLPPPDFNPPPVDGHNEDGTPKKKK